jgi:ABC-type antimicrobial peptide transport system permease subunit
VWERRGELALLRALGFSRRALGFIVLMENVVLVAAGLVGGLLPAAIAVAPSVAQQTVPFPWVGLLLMFVGILLAGMLAGVVALWPALRASLLPALRAE